MRVVVGAAVVAGGRLLVAQRAEPPHMRGLWELPGGSVEVGETEVDALERELREELAYAVVVGGRATGVYGLAIGLPQLALLTGGVWAWDRIGAAPVLLAGAVLPLLALPAMALLPRRVAPAPAESAPTEALRGAAGPWLVMLVCAASAGGVITVLPLTGATGVAAASLFALTAAQLVGRSVSGELGDRLGLGGRVTTPALAITALGAALAAWGLAAAGPAAVVVGAGLVGLGFGAVQNDTLVTLFARAGPGRSGTASSVWNTAYDSGTGVGATVLAAVLGAAGAPWSFGVAALACLLVVLGSMVAGVRPARAPASR